MAKPPSSSSSLSPSSSSSTLQRKRFLLFVLLVVFSASTVVGFFLRGALSDPCDLRRGLATDEVERRLRLPPPSTMTAVSAARDSPLGFMRSKLVLLVSHELSLSGGPLLLMELAFLLRGVGCRVVWITNQNSDETNEVMYSLEHKMLNRGVQVFSAKGHEAIDTALKADLVVLNTAVSGKWLDAVLKEHVPKVLPKILWWIHEMRGHYFSLEYVKHLPLVAGAMIDSYTTAEYWKNRTQHRLNIQMPKTYVVHLGNSKELMEVAEDSVARRVLREHIRESLGVRSEDLLFAIINIDLLCDNSAGVSRGKVVVGSDMTAQTKFETELRNFVLKKGIEDCVHFVNKTLTVAPYLAAIDVLVQNSQGTAAGGTTEIVVHGSTGLLHPAGKDGILPLAQNMVKLATRVDQRLTMGKKGYERVKERFMEHHMAERIASVLKQVLQKSKDHTLS
ncbi:hypothetical protein ACMD2_08392 [Ananas comosus]|uniref:Glycosyl transferase family 1 domain-containing protein n=1 Tax=Ananas comosus TaxID=4615 RepID=A0A199W356_ANACO|nr:hypothetical protein ACMD2_08392 [Ananas comosus]